MWSIIEQNEMVHKSIKISFSQGDTAYPVELLINLTKKYFFSENRYSRLITFLTAVSLNSIFLFKIEKRPHFVKTLDMAMIKALSYKKRGSCCNNNVSRAHSDTWTKEKSDV